MRSSVTIATSLLATALIGCSSNKPASAPSPVPASGNAAVARADSGASRDSAALVAAVMKGTAGAVPASRRDRSVLSRQEILATNYTNAYDVILALRGNWLRTRAAESFGKSSAVQVYLDTQRLSGADELKSMAPTNIASIRFFDPITASARWGMDHGAGAIFIVTAKP